MTRKRPPKVQIPPQLSASERLRTQIRQLMKKKGATYRTLAESLTVSESTVKRLLHREDWTFSRLEQIAKVFDLDVFDLMDLARESTPMESTLTEEQELYLATHGKIAHYFWLLMQSWSPADIASKKYLSAAATESYLSALVNAQLIRRDGPTGVVRLYSWPLAFRFNGPLQRKFAKPLFELFLNHLFERVGTVDADKPDTSDFTVRMTQFLLPKSSYATMLQEISELTHAYSKESRRRLAMTPIEELESVTFMVGADRFDAAAATFGDIK